MGELYRLSFPTGKCYIGITVGTARDRYSAHRAAARKGVKTPVYGAWRKHGEPKLEVLAILENHCLGETEQRAIAAFKTMVPNGYNVSPGGDISPMKDPVVAAKVSAARLGMKMSEETKAKMSAAILGNKRLLGFRHSEASRAKMSAARKGKKFDDPERSRKLSEALKGRVVSEETRARNKAAAKLWMAERKASDPEWWAEMVAKRGEAIKAGWAAKKGNKQ